MTGNRPSGFSTRRPHRVCAALALLCPLLLGAPAAAQGLKGLQSGDQPLEINAEDGIEWRRNEQLYIARGNAEAIRGELTLYADVMTAHYDRSETGDTDIDRIDVEGNVRIVSPSQPWRPPFSG